MDVSDIGRNAGNPVPTGLHILDTSDHLSVPKTATHPDGSSDALSGAENGEVIPPADPIDSRLQRPLDELIAKELARGLVPVNVVGLRGSGKNYLLKYLCHKTKRGYQSADLSISRKHSAEELRYSRRVPIEVRVPEKPHPIF